MLRLLFRILGLLLLLAGFAFLARDLYLWTRIGRFAPLPLGQYWEDWSPGGFGAGRAAVERYWPPLWDGFLQPMLLGPAFLTAAGLGLLLLLVTYRRRRRHWR